MTKPKYILITEELLMFILSIIVFAQLSFSWWIFPLTILLPDVGMAGYLINDRFGARIYNLFHHKGLALIIFASGFYFQNEIIQLSGIIMFGHASMDRILGFGLKFDKGFKYTHLGELK